MKQVSMKNTLLLFGIIALCCVFADAAQSAETDAGYPYAVMTAERNESGGSVTVTLEIRSAHRESEKIEKVVDGGVDTWEQFGEWYEELFALTSVFFS